MPLAMSLTTGAKKREFRVLKWSSTSAIKKLKTKEASLFYSYTNPRGTAMSLRQVMASESW